jgi:hypothetical protein
MIATVGGGASFESQGAEPESVGRWELKAPQENRDRRKGKRTGKDKRRFLTKDKEVPLVCDG